MGASGEAQSRLRADARRNADDIHALLRDNSIALEHGALTLREDYDRRSTFILAGVHAQT